MVLIRSAWRNALFAAGLLLAAAGAAQADVSFSIASQYPIPSGTDFSLQWDETSVPVDGYTDADLLVNWDPTVLTLTSWSAGTAFGTASLVANGVDIGGGTAAPGWIAFTIARDLLQAQPVSFGTDILTLGFSVAPGTAAGTTDLYVFKQYPDYTATGYYSFDAVGTSLDIAAAVPEPASVALMLAGLVALGAAVRRRV